MILSLRPFALALLALTLLVAALPAVAEEPAPDVVPAATDSAPGPAGDDPTPGAIPGILPGAELILQARFGAGTTEVAGPDEDRGGVTDGFPPAFALDPKGRILVLDAGNGRVMAHDGKGGLEPLFAYSRAENGVHPATRDIVVLKSGVVALSHTALAQVRLYDAAGAPLAFIEGVPAEELGTALDGSLIALHGTTRHVMKFQVAGHAPWSNSLQATVEGPDFFPVSHTGLSVYGRLMSSVEVEVLVARFGGKIEKLLSVKPGPDGEYIGNVRPVGCDGLGRLYLECLFLRDVDPAHEKHTYRMAILRVNTRTNAVEKEIPVQPFRGQNSTVAPRQYLVTPEGDLLTYDLDHEVYKIFKYKFGE